MKIEDLQVGKKYAFYSWLSVPGADQSFEHGKKRYFNEDTLIKEIRKDSIADSYILNVISASGWDTWRTVDSNCHGAVEMKGRVHHYELRELDD